MKLKIIMLLTAVLILTGCSSFREIDVSDDGETRRITTEDTSEIDVPSEPKNIVLFRTIDAGNAALLGFDVSGVNSGLENNSTVEDAFGADVTYLEPGDIDSLKEINPDLIVTYSPDEYFEEYQKIAPAIRITYSSGIMSPFSPRAYLTQLYYLGVILNKEDEANRIGDEWEAETTVLKRELNEQVDDKQALVAVEHEDGYLLYNEYMSYGTEAVYDVLGFRMDSNAKSDLEENLFDVKQPEDFNAFETDYMFVNTANPDNTALQEQFAEMLGIPVEQVILLNKDDYITNDLISVRKQTEYIVKKINEAGE
ncbi:ABC transporter substrate-binding protein [Jeotgalicoccus coquinae]|uniref:Iron complex transport system substrate-binding protein n=1 Tax=Jeotgalicoccus coquinae TaxID=709509 RepID=A0A6V7RR19_9STAP|nr:ABC transporter substrate-binding protein [Jeotgalicoccus coquinae]MBB6424175.1 iron complex transport system substrate-binding protein [Jeotgalicoccus coquinae]GGE25924.1 ABC transporter substrate-binding protein [Jeotgalicoccus coquinae]CAD2081466.1 Periplasmic binding protein [Jeotgalicoccus coquinae]